MYLGTESLSTFVQIFKNQRNLLLNHEFIAAQNLFDNFGRVDLLKEEFEEDIYVVVKHSFGF